MNEQPTALRLADEHDNDDFIASTRQWREEAAAELRKQHAHITTLKAALRQAVEAFELYQSKMSVDMFDAALAAAKQALGEA